MTEENHRSDIAPDAGSSGVRVRLREFSRSLPMALLRARESVMRHFRPDLRRFDLTEQQWRVLRALSSVVELEVTRLADATFLLAPSLSRILPDLEGRGLIKRRALASDQRFGLVSLSPEGETLIKTVGVNAEEIYREMTRRVGAERLSALMALLREVEDAVGQGPLIESPGARAPQERPRKRGRPRKAPPQ